MLTEQEIKQALHASRVAPMPMAVPHVPFGWEHLAQKVSRFFENNGTDEAKIVQSLEMPLETWQQLEKLADEATRIEARPVSAAEVAAAILQHYFNGDVVS